MSGMVRGIMGGESDAEKRARRASENAEAQALKRAEDKRAADTDRKLRLDKQKKEEDILAQSKRKIRPSSQKRTVLTSPLGLDDESLA